MEEKDKVPKQNIAVGVGAGSIPVSSKQELRAEAVGSQAGETAQWNCWWALVSRGR